MKQQIYTNTIFSIYLWEKHTFFSFLISENCRQLRCLIRNIGILEK